jgi:pilus assembly protein CpaB
MNRTRIIMVLAVAALLALLASVGAYKFLSEKSRMAETARLETVGIAVALVEIPLGSTINSNQVAIAAWPKETYPKDAFPEAKSAVGRMVYRDFVKGEPIVESKLVPVSGGGSGILSLKVPPKMRAFSVKVNEVVGVGGFIVPGSRVDVVVTTTTSQRQQEQISKIILENTLVLAAGQAIEQKENKPVTVNTVTLAVTPEDSEKLALASNDGKIQFVLRNFADSDNVLTTGSDKARLLASFRHSVPAPAASQRPGGLKRVSKKESPPAAEPPQKKRYVVEILKGNKRSEEKFE